MGAAHDGRKHRSARSANRIDAQLSSAFEAFSDGAVNGFLHSPARDVRGAIVLTHGAGGNCGSELLIATAGTLQAAGFHVLRFDLPFRLARRFGPPHPSGAARDRDGIRVAAGALQKHVGIKPWLAGHSYGGRQASMLAAEDPDISDGLLLLSYPLHPPSKPDQLRTAHFPNLRVPTVFVHGDADSFGSVAEMELATMLLPAQHRLSVVEKAGHDLKRGRFDFSRLLVEPLLGLL